MMRRPLLKLAVLTLLLVLDGCGAAGSPGDFNWDDPKITAMRPAVRQLAEDSIAIEEHHYGRPLQLNYCISIEPRISEGFAERGEGGPNLLETGIEGNLAFTCAAETIAGAQIAVVDEAIMGADHRLRTGTYLFIWRENRWQTAADYELELLEKRDPQAAARTRKTIASINAITRAPATRQTPSTMPQGKP